MSNWLVLASFPSDVLVVRTANQRNCWQLFVSTSTGKPERYTVQGVCGRHSDPALRSKLSTPLPTMVGALLFYREKALAFFPLSTRF